MEALDFVCVWGKLWMLLCLLFEGITSQLGMTNIPLGPCYRFRPPRERGDENNTSPLTPIVHLMMCVYFHLCLCFGTANSEQPYQVVIEIAETSSILPAMFPTKE